MYKIVTLDADMQTNKNLNNDSQLTRKIPEINYALMRNQYFPKPVDENKINDLIMSLNSDLSPVFDKIAARVLKEISKELQRCYFP